MSIHEIRESGTSRMTEEELGQLLTDQGVGVLGLAEGGLPYLLPLSFGYDGEEALYFVYLLFGPESRKEDLTERADLGRFVVYDAAAVHDWRSASLVGRFETVADDEWDDLRAAMENAWHPDLFSSAEPMRGIEGYRFEIESWTAIQQSE
ncbi:pyridoxamine 5'-phosphate oxidase family protein [Haloglomus halophilum]|uniref:pyridoxamine 5'-phosphate oxidase family protein n=1 Tax=Haloglomus halophilum TaxID=2962672 RepID=UPI0020CA0A3F|nr:pyridoxamine 5'-phosphate oxidase family protein [Haloglomus halophilum]